MLLRDLLEQAPLRLADTHLGGELAAAQVEELGELLESADRLVDLGATFGGLRHKINLC